MNAIAECHDHNSLIVGKTADHQDGPVTTVTLNRPECTTRSTKSCPRN